MLYETSIKLGKKDKDYKVKIGIKEAIKLQRLGINLAEETTDIEVFFKMLVVGLSFVEKQKNELFVENGELITFEKSTEKIIQMWEDSETTTYNDLAETINKAIDLGLNKGKETKKQKKLEEEKEAKKEEIKQVKNY